ncbi:aldo/keto reductase family oxidoreductase [Fictibacillus iocasae]|uniref:Aldo/keto reductase family oxidoreductase n=1 Tax=Fictibacillus iocasae TaxID=2715437 RepID=A0ABW2NU63_9BACL
MEKITLAKDLEFSRIVHGHWRLGEWNLSDQELLALVEQCIEWGITTFDHADIYGGYTCEEIFGKALALKPELREKIQIVSKCGIKLISGNRPEHSIKSYDTSKQHIITSAERSLKNMNTDYLDLLLIHRPDPFMNPEETAEAFNLLKKQGKVRHFGVSNFSPSQYNMLQSYCDVELVTNQIELSVLHTDSFFNGAMDHCLEKRIAPMAWSPLAGGRLFSGSDEQSIAVKKTMEKVGAEIGAESLDETAYAWLLAHPGRIMPIVGSGKKERIASAVKATELNMNTEQWFDILQSSMMREVD